MEGGDGLPWQRMLVFFRLIVSPNSLLARKRDPREPENVVLHDPQQQCHLQRASPWMRNLWIFILASNQARLKIQPPERVWRRMPSKSCPKVYFSIREKNIPKSVGAKMQPCFRPLMMLKATEAELSNYTVSFISL